MKNIAKKEPDLCLYLWLKIRLWQQLHGIDDSMLAQFLGISTRSLRDYDKSAVNVTLGKLDSFLRASGLTLEQLMTI